MLVQQMKKVASALTLILSLCSLFSSQALAITGENTAKASVNDQLICSLASLIRFADDNLKLDERSEELTTVERLRALKHSLELYGVTIPKGAKVTADMKSTKIAKNIVQAMSEQEKEKVFIFIDTFVRSLQEVSVLPPPPAPVKIKMTKATSN